MPIDTWDEVRTAYHVARIGTVSGAADVLGVHHATVIRHVDALEGRLGVKLFQRHARGYTATEAGEDLLKIAAATDEQFAQLAGRLKGRGESVSGDLVVTSVGTLGALLMPVLRQFQDEHPGLNIRFLTDDRLFRLEYGEAHVAIRAGAPHEQQDNVVQPFMTLRAALYVCPSYVERHGVPATEADFPAHRFVGHDSEDNRAPFNKWMRENVPASSIGFRGTDNRVMMEAVLQGVGIGFMSVLDAARYPDLVQVMPPREEWDSKVWLVTHVDLHRTAKVQTFLSHLKAAAKAWHDG